MVEIKQQLVPEQHRKATYGIGNPVKKMVIHQTGNTAKGAGAKVHADLQSRGYGASWHIQSDDKEIIQSWPFTYRLWHASTGQASNGGNMVGIGWEICINSDGNYLKSLEIAALGIAKVMKQEGIPMSQLTTHNAEDPKNKYCPAQILAGKDGVNWTTFKAMVQKAYDGNPVSAPSKPAKPSSPSKSNATIAQEVMAGKWGNDPERTNKLKAAGYNPSSIQSEVNKLASKPSTPSKPALKSNAAIAKEVMAGQWGNDPTRTSKLKAAGYNPSSIQAEVNKLAGGHSAPKPSLKSNSTVAKEVLAGQWGNGDARTNKLKAAGYNPQAVQNEVNKLAGATSKPSLKSVSTVAKEVIDGKWGNNPQREQKLKAAGYNPQAVQKEVNRLL